MYKRWCERNKPDIPNSQVDDTSRQSFTLLYNKPFNNGFVIALNDVSLYYLCEIIVNTKSELTFQSDGMKAFSERPYPP